MSDYETTAYKSLEQLKQQHDHDVSDLHARMKETYVTKYNFSQELMDLRAMERKFHQLKFYDKA